MYPTYPDVKLRNLPFYKIEAVLMKPSSLQPKGLARFQEQTSSFHLTPTQVIQADNYFVSYVLGISLADLVKYEKNCMLNIEY